MCQPTVKQKMVESCCCGSFRSFISKKEEEERLEEYKDQLKKELEGVEERLDELKHK
jgi:hypothetical protein